MNRQTATYPGQFVRFMAIVSALFLLAACASAPTAPDGASDVRFRLNALQNNANLSGLAPVEVRAAEAAVQLAEQPLRRTDEPLGAHRVYLAEQKVELAWARAGTRYAEVQRRELGEAREAARLQARTLEADRARRDAEFARGEASRSRSAADAAQSEQAAAAMLAARRAIEQQRLFDLERDAQAVTTAEANRRAAEQQRQADAARSEQARAATAAANQEAELRRQIGLLEAEVTDRGIVLTLGDVLFATNSADLQPGANRNLDQLLRFLEQYPARRVLIEGHTDNVGNVDFNRGLSQRRADSVRNYLAQNGLAAGRMTVTGMGMDRPVATNDTASGRQQNRRVEIIIEDFTVSARIQ